MLWYQHRLTDAHPLPHLHIIKLPCLQNHQFHVIVVINRILNTTFITTAENAKMANSIYAYNAIAQGKDASIGMGSDGLREQSMNVLLHQEVIHLTTNLLMSWTVIAIYARIIHQFMQQQQITHKDMSQKKIQGRGSKTVYSATSAPLMGTNATGSVTAAMRAVGATVTTVLIKAGTVHIHSFPSKPSQSTPLGAPPMASHYHTARPIHH